MGFDKRDLEVNGETLPARAASVLTEVCEEVAISLQPEASCFDGDFRTIRDQWARCGPLAGLEAGLAEAGGRALFLLACDLPHVDGTVVRHVLDCAAGGVQTAAAVVPSLGGRRQPLCALYRTQALPIVRKHLDSSDRSMTALLNAIEVLDVAIGPDLPFFRTDLFLNLNQPADLANVAGLAR